MAASDHKHLSYFHITALSVQQLPGHRPNAAGDAVTFRLSMGSDTFDIDSESSKELNVAGSMISLPLHHPLPPSFTLEVLHKSSARQVGSATIHSSDVAGNFSRLLMYELRGRRGENVGVVNLTAKLIVTAVPVDKFTSDLPPSDDPASPQTTIHAPYLEISGISAEDLNIDADEAHVLVRTGLTKAGATSVVTNGGSSPWWEETLHIPVPDEKLGCFTLELWCKRRSWWFIRDELAGAAKVPMSDIVEGFIAAAKVLFLSYRVVEKKGEGVGIIKFAVKMVGEKK